MKYENKDKVREILNKIEGATTDIKELRNALYDVNVNILRLRVLDRCTGDVKYHINIEHIRDKLINEEIQPLQKEIEDLKEELKNL